MKQLLSITLIVGFLFVDFLFFHDAFKTGEVITTAQYLTGLLSIPVIVLSAQSLLKTQHKH
jgi:hypothetical protein